MYYVYLKGFSRSPMKFKNNTQNYQSIDNDSHSIELSKGFPFHLFYYFNTLSLADTDPLAQT